MISVYIPSALKRAIVERAQGYCEYCHSPVDWSPQIFEIEHIQPLSSGGRTEFVNLAYAYPACNRYKRNREMAPDPVTGQAVELFNPRLHTWQEHFRWSGHLLLLEGVTPMGRATIAALKMNRKGAQQFRQALVAVGQHPSMS
ncbi:MAG: HNH endonuclease signature motif containing protein [Caldilineaceae bacterium]